MSRACLSTKSSGEFDQDRQIQGVRISVHVYLTDKRAAAQVVYVTMRCGIELDEPRKFGELLCHLTTGTRQRDWRPDTDPSFRRNIRACLSSNVQFMSRSLRTMRQIAELI